MANQEGTLLHPGVSNRVTHCPSTYFYYVPKAYPPQSTMQLLPKTYMQYCLAQMECVSHIFFLQMIVSSFVKPPRGNANISLNY